MENCRTMPHSQGRPNELPPALAQVGQQAAAGLARRDVADVEEGAQGAGEGERGGVGRQHPARADRRDHGTAERGTAHRRALHRHPEDGEGAAGLLAGDRGQQHALGRRAEERVSGAVEGSEQHHLPQPRFTSEHEQGEQALGEAVEGVGGDHHPMPGQAIRYGAADQQDQHQRQRAGGRHQAHVAAVAAAFQHSERGGDQGAMSAEVGDEGGGGQQAVVAPGPRQPARAPTNSRIHRPTASAPARAWCTAPRTHGRSRFPQPTIWPATGPARSRRGGLPRTGRPPCSWNADQRGRMIEEG
jgi:hypothetical protein